MPDRPRYKREELAYSQPRQVEEPSLGLRDGSGNLIYYVPLFLSQSLAGWANGEEMHDSMLAPQVRWSAGTERLSKGYQANFVSGDTVDMSRVDGAVIEGPSQNIVTHPMAWCCRYLALQSMPVPAGEYKWISVSQAWGGQGIQTMFPAGGPYSANGVVFNLGGALSLAIRHLKWIQDSVAPAVVRVPFIFIIFGSSDHSTDPAIFKGLNLSWKTWFEATNTGGTIGGGMWQFSMPAVHLNAPAIGDIRVPRDVIVQTECPPIFFLQADMKNTTLDYSTCAQAQMEVMLETQGHYLIGPRYALSRHYNQEFADYIHLDANGALQLARLVGEAYQILQEGTFEPCYPKTLLQSGNKITLTFGRPRGRGHLLVDYSAGHVKNAGIVLRDGAGVEIDPIDVAITGASTMEVTYPQSLSPSVLSVGRYTGLIPGRLQGEMRTALRLTGNMKYNSPFRFNGGHVQDLYHWCCLRRFTGLT